MPGPKPVPPEVQAATETALQFARYCSTEVDDDATSLLMQILTESILPMIPNNGGRWDGKLRKFSLTSVKKLAKATEGRSASGGKVTADVVKIETKRLQPKFERECPFRSSDKGMLEPLFKDGCFSLTAVLDRQP